MSMILAIEAGGTRSSGALYDSHGAKVREATAGPANPVATGLDAAASVLIALGRELVDDASLGTVCAAVAGVARQPLRDDLAHLLASGLRAPRTILTHDLLAMLKANLGDQPGVLVVAGTGSSLYGQGPGASPRLFGGWGSILGDEGSAYAIALSGLRAAAKAVDGFGDETALTDHLLATLRLHDFRAVPVWASLAKRSEIADLARHISVIAEAGDVVARRCILEHAEALGQQAARTCKALALPPKSPVLIHGGVFSNSAQFREAFAACVPDMVVTLPRYTGPDAVRMLIDIGGDAPDVTVLDSASTGEEMPSPTEARATLTRPIDALSASEIVSTMNREDHRAADAVAAQAEVIAAVMKRVAASFQAGGRLIYVGAGTSGRLGVLDASECPPTFGVAPDRVIGLIAGGERALRESVEGAEDDADLGARDLAALLPPPDHRDIVVGIAASGSTPYVHGALAAAKAAGAGTALVCCNPLVYSPAEHTIALATGAEVLSGSTRLKAGTATKLVLNMITTGGMALSGLVYEGLMIEVRPVNAKLKRRTRRIVSILTGLNTDASDVLMQAAGEHIPVAILMHRRGLDRQPAEDLLRAHGGILRAALQEVEG